MKKTLLSVFAFCISTIAFSQSFGWGKTFGGKMGEKVNGCATDAQGNIYLTGSFRDTVDFDPGPNVFNLMPSNGFNDMFLLKLDSSGQFQWAKRFGGISNDDGVALVASGNDIYLAGIFLNQIQLDGFTITQNGSDFASFVCKLNSAGDVIWADALINENGGTVRVQALALDKDGGIYASGYFSGTLSNNSSLYPYTGTLSGFIYKADKDGLNTSVQTILGDYITECRGIGVDKDYNIYVCGTYAGETDFAPGADSIKITSENFSFDIFVLKLSETPGNSWVRSIGIDGTEHANALVVDDSSNIYFAGSIRNIVDFTDDSSIVLTAGSQRDSYVAKLNSSGQTQWAHVTGSADNQNSGQAKAMGIDRAGNIYVGGIFGGKIDFDFGVDTFYMSTVSGSDDGYILKLTPDAEFLWARRVGGTNQVDEITCMAINGEDYFYVAGTFTGTTNLDPMGDGVLAASNSGSVEDGFVIKYSNDLPVSIFQKENIQNKIFLYPNPSSAEVFILNQTNQPIKSVVVYDMAGRVLMQQQENADRINLSRLTSGLYNVEILTIDNVKTVKIIQKH